MKEIQFVESAKPLLVALPDAGRTTGKACCQKKTPEVFDRIERKSPWMIGKVPAAALSQIITTVGSLAFAWRVRA